jgi:excinuclease ABC subunit B
MERAITEMNRRRGLQEAYNEEHGITPTSIHKSVDQVRLVTRVADARAPRPEPAPARGSESLSRAQMVEVLEQQMREAATELDFELAAQLRDQLFELRADADPERHAPRGVGGGRGKRRA